MQLKKYSWHYKMWTNSFSTFEKQPEQTDLCRYCHRIFWQLLLRGLLCLCLLGILWMLGYALIYRGLILNTLITLEILAGIAAVVTMVVLYVKWLDGRNNYKEPKTLVGKYAYAAKRGVCPLVDFTDETTKVSDELN